MTGDTTGAAIERFIESITAVTTRVGYAETLFRSETRFRTVSWAFAA
ncbi:hypothetical protein [Nonomuraea rubra]